MQHAVLSPDALGPTVCGGEILVEIVATSIGEGFRTAQPLVGPYPSGAPAITSKVNILVPVGRSSEDRSLAAM